MSFNIGKMQSSFKSGTIRAESLKSFFKLEDDKRLVKYDTEAARAEVDALEAASVDDGRSLGVDYVKLDGDDVEHCLAMLLQRKLQGLLPLGEGGSDANQPELCHKLVKS